MSARVRIAGFTLGLVVAAFVRPALGSFGLAPTTVTMDARDRSASIAVTNNNLAPRVFQAELFAWSQDGARQVLTPATDLIAAPPVFTLAAGETQTLRVGVRKLQPRPVEGTYRVIITEAPSGLGRRSGVDITTRASVPIFVEPQTPERPKPALSVLRRDASHLELAIDNPGIEHIHVLDARVLDATKRPVYDGGARGYVLAKQRQLFALNLQHPTQSETVSVHVVADDATYDAVVPVRKP